jgi:DNA repair exonuclease SbcCD ATPase subunit
LEQENAALLAKIERQQRQLRDGFAVRDQSIRRLNEMLLQQDSKQPDQSDSRERPDDIKTADDLIRDLQRRLAREIARGDRMERRFNEASALSSAKDRTLQRLKEELEATRHELALVESHLDEMVGQPRPAPEVVLNLSGITLLYVGGRCRAGTRQRSLDVRKHPNRRARWEKSPKGP